MVLKKEVGAIQIQDIAAEHFHVNLIFYSTLVA